MAKSAKSLMKEYDFNYIEEYFTYIFESWQNGQLKQAENLFQSLDRKGRKDFVGFLIDYKDSKDVPSILYVVI